MFIISDLAGSVYRYDIENNVIEKAQPLGKMKNAVTVLYEFGSRTGRLIEVKGGYGDAGCESSSYSDYDFVTNTIELKKESFFCEGDTSEHWKFY